MSNCGIDSGATSARSVILWTTLARMPPVRVSPSASSACNESGTARPEYRVGGGYLLGIRPANTWGSAEGRCLPGEGDVAGVLMDA